MTPFISDADFTLYVGDALEVLRQLPDGSVDCCVTSPPYWGLRDYGTEGQLGLEATPGEYVEAIVAVFREVRRVLADHGTLWLNLGDSYNNRNMSRTSSHQGGLGFDSEDLRKSWVELKAEGRTRMAIEDGDLKEKDLVGVPWMVAFALRADGWYLRSDIIWSKPNPMPESVTDRPTKSHEYVFLLSKQPRYYFDQEAVREKFETVPQARHTSTADQPKGAGRAAAGIQNPLVQGGPHVRREPQGESLLGDPPPPGRKLKERTVRPGVDIHGGGQGSGAMSYPLDGRNIRSVWEIATQPYAEAHFATFPEELPRKCIAAGCPEQVCSTCGKARERIVEVESSWRSRAENGAVRGNLAPEGLVGAGTQRAVHGAGVSHDLDPRSREVLGWSDCGCAYGLDPDALELIATPTGARAGDDPSLQTGRAGMNRPRGDNEGVRPITRFEQRAYAAQLRDSPYRAEMEASAGPAFAHYIRTDTSGARPLPPELLELWIAIHWISRVELPERAGGNYRPGVVLDPFLGSGTTALVARKLGRRAIGIELNPEYAELAGRRLQQLSLFA